MSNQAERVYSSKDGTAWVSRFTVALTLVLDVAMRRSHMYLYTMSFMMSKSFLEQARNRTIASRGLGLKGRIKIDGPVITTRVGVLGAGVRSLLAY